MCGAGVDGGVLMRLTRSLRRWVDAVAWTAPMVGGTWALATETHMPLAWSVLVGIVLWVMPVPAGGDA